MKQNFTLALLLFASVFAFGQRSKLLRNIQPSQSQIFTKQLDRLRLDVAEKQAFLLQEEANIQQLKKSEGTAKPRLDSIVTNVWNSETKKWILAYKQEFEYNQDGQIIVKLFKERNSFIWSAVEKEKYTYNANGNVTNYSISQWSNTSNRWVGLYNELYLYNGNGKIEQQLDIYDELLDKDGYSQLNVTNYSYDGSGKKTQGISNLWSEKDAYFGLYNKQDHSYNASGKEEQSLIYFWDSPSGEWSASSKIEFKYDANNRLTERTSLAMSTDWVTVSKTNYVYSADGNIGQKLDYSKDFTENQEINSKTEYTYDSGSSFSDLILPYPPNEEVPLFFRNNRLTNYVVHIKDTQSGEYVQVSKSDLFYSDYENIVNSISESHENKIVIHPNPVNNSLFISAPSANKELSIEIHDLQGRKVLDKKNLKERNVDLENLNKGIYLYTISFDGKTQKGKLIKK